MQNIKDYEMMAKLDLSDAEREQIAAMAKRLIDSFEALADIDTEGVEPLVTVLDVQNVFRKDSCTKMFTREEILANVPMQCDGYFQVPKTL